MVTKFVVIVLCLCFSLIPPGLCCGEDEYKTRNGSCCWKCREGTVVQRDCTPQSDTQCRPCEPGTFMNQRNGLNLCFQCTSCDPVHGLIAKRNCTEMSDTVCDVLRGYYCRALADDAGCSLAERHSNCAPGQRIKVPGTSRNDTVCEDCPPEYFSKDGVNCTAWTICSENQVKDKEGSINSDVVCRSAPRNHYTLLVPFSLFFICSILVTTRATNGDTN